MPMELSRKVFDELQVTVLCERNIILSKSGLREDELPYYWPQKEGRSEDSQHILSTQDLVSHICDYRGIINSLWLFVDLHKSQIDIFF